MEIKVKIYSCYKLTYSSIYKKILKYYYGQNFNVNSALLEIEDISENNKLNIQSQRIKTNYVTRTIRIYENDVLKHIVGLSNTNYDLDKKKEFELGLSKKEKSSYGANDYHANTYLKQGINKIFDFYFKNKTTADLSFYLLDTDKKTNTHNNLFNTLSYRELETIGFKILNIDEINFSSYEKQCHSKLNKSNLSFSSFNKYIKDIAYISKKNSSNIPSFLQCEEKANCDKNGNKFYMTEKYTYTFKSLSAQGYDSLLRIWCMKTLADKENTKIEFILGKQYFAFEEEQQKIADKLTNPIIQTLDKANIQIELLTNETFMKEKAKADNVFLNYRKENKLRNQNLFRNNIRKKGIPMECSVCGKDNPILLDAAHIWEVNSIEHAPAKEINDFIKIYDLNDLIDKSSKYKNDIFFKKYSLINSGENGIWLCKNHHKLFDENYYCFDSKDGKILLHFNDPTDALGFAEEIEEYGDSEIQPSILSKATKAFIKKRQYLVAI